MAYFTNSYPQDSPKTHSLLTLIKIVCLFTYFVELICSVGLVTAVIRYTAIVQKVDSVIHTGAFSLLVTSMARIFSSHHARDYGRERTDRTPERRIETSKLLKAVTIISLVVGITVIHLLNTHAVTTTTQAINESNSLLLSADIQLKIADSVSGLQSSVLLSFILHVFIHCLVHRLNSIEKDVPRIVDLKASGSTPKKEE